MQVNYCDLCGQPLKGESFYTLYIKDPTIKSVSTDEDYWNALLKYKEIQKKFAPHVNTFLIKYLN